MTLDIPPFAIIDCGTNTFHLLIARVVNGEIVILHRSKEVARIGAGGINQGIITLEARQRAKDKLELFKAKIVELEIQNVHGFATSAFRNAQNGNVIKNEIKNELGIDLQIISGDREAELIFQGVNFALKYPKEPMLVMDIGGGSVEFIIGMAGKIWWKKSFEIGGQRLLEKFHFNDPIDKREIQSLEDYLSTELQELFNVLHEYDPKLLGGSSGTFDTLSDIYCVQKGLAVDDEVPERPFELSHFYDIHNELISKNRYERLQIPGMIPMRVDMIVVASCLINYLLKNSSFTQLRVSTYSLKEGILSELIHSN